MYNCTLYMYIRRQRVFSTPEIWACIMYVLFSSGRLLHASWRLHSNVDVYYIYPDCTDLVVIFWWTPFMIHFTGGAAAAAAWSAIAVDGQNAVCKYFNEKKSFEKKEYFNEAQETCFRWDIERGLLKSNPWMFLQLCTEN